jgi:segregation and condensation protein A
MSDVSPNSAPAVQGELYPDEFPGFIVTWLNSEGEEEQGPLSLLWKLIESYRVDIFNISLYTITNDFIQFLKRADELRLEIASPFLVMAARLIYYKSKALLPDPGFDDPDNDPRLPPELIAQLLEYRKFQLASDHMTELDEVTVGILGRPSVNLDHLKEANEDGEEWIELDVVDLVRAFDRVMKRIDQANAVRYQMQVSFEEYSVDEKMQTIRNLLTDAVSFEFTDLFTDRENLTRGEVVTVFLAMLELVKIGEIIIRQNVMFGSIHVFKKSIVVS